MEEVEGGEEVEEEMEEVEEEVEEVEGGEEEVEEEMEGRRSRRGAGFLGKRRCWVVSTLPSS